MSKEDTGLKEIIDLSTEINRTKDIDMLLDSILAKARAFTNADGGSIYVKEDDRLTFKCVQNETLQKRLGPGRKLVHTRLTVPLSISSIVGYVATTGKALNIPDAYALQPGSPYVFNAEFDRISNYRTTSVLSLPLESNNEIVGVLQLINAKTPEGETVPFPGDVEFHLRYFANIAATALERAQLTRSIILRMIKMAEMHDPKETGAHVNRVAGYAVEIYEAWAKARDVDKASVEKTKDILRMASMLHDVGKIGIPDTILKKPGRLDESEFRTIKEHARLGASLFFEKQSDFDEVAFLVAGNHHERWDGNGYPGHIDLLTGEAINGQGGSEKGRPRGKRGQEIPILARIVSVSDVYDALCSRRCYKEAYEETRVLDEIRAESGRAFDPEVVEAFFAAFPNFRNVALQYPDAE
jgi:HD-GYP domain-containing protein (c-di-GMP phosphodiesterase class II)